MTKREIQVKPGQEVPFHNNVGFCIGTGRMGLALQKEYLDQLALVQKEIGFSHIRGHGLFCDDMAIYHEYDEDGQTKAEYNYTYLDLVMDSYLRLGLKPFLELGFMPDQLASGKQTIFYWKGNTTPPKDYDRWAELVQNLLRHLIGRYGADEVTAWPIEVWNEPNLPGFWENADMQEYFKLFSVTLRAVKEVDERFGVGGPAICGVRDAEWMRAFLDFCREQKIRPDFITRHHYTTEFPESVGHYGYARLSDPEYGFANLQSTRDIIDSYPEFKGLKIHITEFNTSYIPNCPLHDTNENAAFIAHQLSRLGDVNESYSYWTFGDIFEEQGVPFTPFHGGFGLVANGCIPKPTFWTFAFYKQLQEQGGKCVYRDDHIVILENGDGYCGVAWNHQPDGENIPEQDVPGRTKDPLELLTAMPERTGNPLEFLVALPAQTAEYTLILKTVDEETCNPLKIWHDMGEPANLSEEQTRLLRESARPLVTSGRIRSAKGAAELRLSLKPHAVQWFSLTARVQKSDRGYDYERVIRGEGECVAD